MSVQRLFRWTCDDCGHVEERVQYGLPTCWLKVDANLRDGHGTLHFCTMKCHLHYFPKDTPDKDDQP